MPVEAPIADRTIRMVVRPTVGGSRVRVRFSNACGPSAVSIGAAHMALTGVGSRIKPETDRILTFGGKAAIDIAAGAPALSDPVDLPIKAFDEVTISIYLPVNTPVTTVRVGAQRESFLAGPGDLTSKVDLPDGEKKATWYFLSGVEVWAAATTTTTVALGDSITQGSTGKPGESWVDWPDQLALRLSGEKTGPAIALVNEGIAGNRILHDAAGISVLARFDRDVLALPGVTRLILFEGINDIGFPRIRMSEIKGVGVPKESPFVREKVSADDMIQGLQQLVARAHEHGIQVFGATITPFEGTNSYDSEGEAIRQAVNQWIRTTKEYDAIFDFDALIRDPMHTSRLRAEYDSGDHIHPNAAGYKALADSISLPVLRADRR
jgi:lysophospholipase L1-like esterase